MSAENIAIRSHQLTMALLDEYPVWGAYDEDDSEVIRPVLAADPFSADCDPLTIKADFITVKKATLTGCIVIDRAFDSIYLIEIYAGEQWFGFNISLVDIAVRQLKKLQESLQRLDDPIFPVRYQTSFTGPNGEKLEGLFSPFT